MSRVSKTQQNDNRELVKQESSSAIYDQGIFASLEETPKLDLTTRFEEFRACLADRSKVQRDLLGRL